jgi:hypothetical protein
MRRRRVTSVGYKLQVKILLNKTDKKCPSETRPITNMLLSSDAKRWPSASGGAYEDGHAIQREQRTRVLVEDVLEHAHIYRDCTWLYIYTSTLFMTFQFAPESTSNPSRPQGVLPEIPKGHESDHSAPLWTVRSCARKVAYMARKCGMMVLSVGDRGKRRPLLYSNNSKSSGRCRHTPRNAIQAFLSLSHAAW